jgi:FkbM family methyltransferase
MKITLRPNTSDDYIYREIFKSNVYQKRFKIQPDDVVLDIGAHVGMFAYQAGCLAKEVHSYEMDEDNYKELRRNIRANRLKTVYATHAAVRLKNGRTECNKLLGKNLGNHSLFIKPNHKRVVVEVPSVSIHDVLKKVKPTFIKLDCEGCEQELLNPILDYHPHRLALEYHPEIIKDPGVYEALYDRLLMEYDRFWAKPPGTEPGRYFMVYACTK